VAASDSGALAVDLGGVLGAAPRDGAMPAAAKTLNPRAMVARIGAMICRRMMPPFKTSESGS
jgi:hypothetical protein